MRTGDPCASFHKIDGRPLPGAWVLPAVRRAHLTTRDRPSQTQFVPDRPTEDNPQRTDAGNTVQCSIRQNVTRNGIDAAA
jgi:hypothetical protein